MAGWLQHQACDQGIMQFLLPAKGLQQTSRFISFHTASDHLDLAVMGTWWKRKGYICLLVALLNPSEGNH